MEIISFLPPLIVLLSTLRIFFKRVLVVVCLYFPGVWVMVSDKDREEIYSGDVPKRGPMPNLPNLRVSIAESPDLSKEIKRIRIKNRTLGAFFKHVLEDERND